MIRLAERHSDWTVGFLDEVWWSRFAHPAGMHAWSPKAEPLRLVGRRKSREDNQPKALSCYGVLMSEDEEDRKQEMLLRFVRGRPVSHVTTAFLNWTCRQLDMRGKRVWVLVWDNASWHKSREVRRWIKRHNRRAKRSREGVRILVCELPTRSPWLNPIEPKWMHGKRAICEPNGKLTAGDVIERACAYYGCEKLPRLEQQTS